ncbi:hypothetical protein BIFGAL_04026 [Bifidobacterium gallicum DSM 20093 = LMG 11596]|uniref:Uncharacterized protein n=1 Tax=Bifidobacterium gallicum DSM 20093 = LMG 11596 TaxID=561180 RepID=D1NVY2_9BIFI|nr:hypothetical protein BIFGAL_04026 [Bifidobacterium gallicum DSM 20093 = LMG 11596]
MRWLAITRMGERAALMTGAVHSRWITVRLCTTSAELNQLSGCRSIGA